MTPTLHPAHDPRAPVAFLALDALAAHLIRQRPGRTVELIATQVSLNGAPLLDGASAYAIQPRDRRAFQDDPAAFEADWLGVALAGDRPVAALTAALARVRSAGGLAA